MHDNVNPFSVKPHSSHNLFQPSPLNSISAWKTQLSFEVRDLGENKAIFLFEDETDMVWVLDNGPW